MRILIAVPFGPSPHRIHPLTQQSIDALGHADIAYIETPVGTIHDKAELCRKHNEARRLTLEGGYDALLHIDADMVIPADVIARLSAVEADVAYGLYVSRHTPSRWMCWTERTTVITDTTLADTAWGEHQPSYGAGMGCTLIRSNVLYRLAFRTDGSLGSDWWFAADCDNYGFSQAHDLGCVCGHINGKGVLWPDPTTDEMYRIEAL